MIFDRLPKYGKMCARRKIKKALKRKHRCLENIAIEESVIIGKTYTYESYESFYVKYTSYDHDELSAF